MTTKFSIDYTHSWSQSESKGTTKSHTFKQSVPMEVPKGKVYRAILTASEQRLVIPYSAYIYMSGLTRVAVGHPAIGVANRYQLDAGAACAEIHDRGLAGADSRFFGRDPSNTNRGGVVQFGQLTAEQTANFNAQIRDVTASYDNASFSEASMQPRDGEALRGQPLEGTLVREIAF